MVVQRKLMRRTLQIITRALTRRAQERLIKHYACITHNLVCIQLMTRPCESGRCMASIVVPDAVMGEQDNLPTFRRKFGAAR